MISLSHATVWNAPYPASEIASKTLFVPFSSPPKHLDPVVAYSSNEWMLLGQIYEPPLQYNYLKRPYTLEPLTLRTMPEVAYLDARMRPTNEHAKIAYTRYRFTLRSDIRYAPHAAFVKDTSGMPSVRVDDETAQELRSAYDIAPKATRRVTAYDYAYAIKRMALRTNHSPILDMMMHYIVGLADFSKRYSPIAARKKRSGEWFDLRPLHIAGVRVHDDRHFDIVIRGRYPQFLYWMAMYFFAPVPWEAEAFYAQPALRKANIDLDTAPVGSGAYYLAEFRPERRMVLAKNPQFHMEKFPALPASASIHYNNVETLKAAEGKRLPFIDRVVFSMEKESIPLWNKFLQGYYDASGVGSEAFDQAIRISAQGEMGLSEQMRAKKIKMLTAVQPSIFYMAFNMEDPVVGGYDEKHRLLRRAIAIAQDTEEYISIFMNGRGVVAHSPIPPGIAGHGEGKTACDTYVYRWEEGKCVRRTIAEAKAMLAKAGYPNGIDPATGKPLKLYYDVTATGPDDRALLEWRRKQFAKLGIELVVRATDYNRFQEKIRLGKAQIFSWGWNADYPDAENFLFLLYGPNAVTATQGAGMNSANYANPDYDALFDRIKTMPDSPERRTLIAQMVEIARKDAPWVWGVYPKSISLLHDWYRYVVANAMANNTLKYKRIAPRRRVAYQARYNRPAWTPMAASAAAVLLFAWGAAALYRRRENRVIKKEC